nr:hypothetical protein [Tanacetum cinerariifolium]
VPQPSGLTESVADEAIHKELGDSLVRAVITTSSLEAEQVVVPDSQVSRNHRDTITQTRALDLEKTKTTQKNEIDSLKRRVKKLEKRNRLRTHKLKRLYKVGLSARVESFRDKESLGEDASKQGRRIDAIDANEDNTLVNDADNKMFDVDDLGEEPVKPKKKDQIRLDVEAALKLQVGFDEEERLARERAKKEQEANIDLIETWDDIQEKIDDDHQNHFAAKKAEEKRNKPPTKAQQRKIICTYLKNMKGYKLKDLKLKEFDRIQEMSDRAFRRVNTFKDFRPELVKGKEKRAGEEMIQEITKKQKVDDDKENAELK